MAPYDKMNTEQAKAALEAMGGSIMFEKVLTSSDANGTGRLVIPKSQAEAHFPFLEQQQGILLNLTDTEGRKHAFRFRFWINNQSSRMYLLENTMELLQLYSMSAGDVLVFAKLPDGNYGICGRKGTKDDVSRKPATRRPKGEADGEDGGGRRRRRTPAGESAKSKRMRAQAAQPEQGLFTYWAGCLPMRRDGVFRAAPSSAAQEGDKVVAQYGAWSAIVNMGGELFQAFFDTYEAASAAFEAAVQGNKERGSGGAPSPAAQEQQQQQQQGAAVQRPGSVEPQGAAVKAEPTAAAAAGAGAPASGEAQLAAAVKGEEGAQGLANGAEPMEAA